MQAMAIEQAVVAASSTHKAALKAISSNDLDSASRLLVDGLRVASGCDFCRCPQVEEIVLAMHRWSHASLPSRYSHGSLH
jgi:hypothetical protein